jgi:SAM-dependent methyltransferase
MSSNWNHGYNTDQGYTYGYYQETAPVWLDWALRLKNQPAPSSLPLTGGKYRYLDLGCGQGLSMLLHAAAHPDMEFVGIDFNAAHIIHAQQLASRAGLTNVRFIEGDFAELARNWPEDLGQFHYTVMHGIYSWMAPSLRHALVQCLRNAVVHGGAVYISYNAMPGWAARKPLQHLLRQIHHTSGLPSQQAIEQGLQLCDRLQAANAQVFVQNPRLAPHIQHTKTQNRNYVVQEYLHDNWHPLWFSEVAQELAAAKLQPLSTATLPEAYLPHLLPPELRQLVLDSTKDPIFQQELTDLVTNQSFRRDVFVRGVTTMWPATLRRQWLEQAFCYLHPKLENDKRNTIVTSFGELTNDATLADALREALTTGPQTLAQLMGHPIIGQSPWPTVVQVLTLLMHARQISPWQAKPDKTAAHRLNRALAAAVCEGAPYNYLVTPHTSLSIAVSDTSLMLLDVYATPIPQKITSTTLAQGLRERLQRLNRQVQHDGKPLPPNEAIAKLELLTQDFLNIQLPMFKRLGAWPA